MVQARVADFYKTYFNAGSDKYAVLKFDFIGKK